MDEEKILKFECTLDWIIFPKYVKKVESNEFAIFRANITKALENCSEEMDQIKLK